MPVTADIKISLEVGKRGVFGFASRQIRRVVCEKDHYTCRCCGLVSTKYQETVAMSGNWRDVSSIFTACIFCQQCFFIEAVAEMRSGVLISFSEMEQTELNRLAMEIYVARISTLPVADKARASLDFLMGKREACREILGFDGPNELVAAFNQYEVEGNVPMLREALSTIRLFPLDRRIIREADLEFNQFPQILAYWRSKSGPLQINNLPRLENFAKTYL